MPVLYVSDSIHPAALGELSDLGHVHLGYGVNPVRYADIKEDVDAVLLRGEIFDAEKIAASPRLKIIARHGVGTDNVDIAAATAASVWVTTTPGSNSRAVAEHVFALVLSLARQLPSAARGIASGQWGASKAELNGGFELRGRTLGLVGFGSIATEVLEIGRGIGMTVLTSDPYASAAVVARRGATLVPLDQLVADADVVSLHLPLNDETRHILDSDTIARMRRGAVLINTSRGGLIDELALVDALERGHLSGAALDVLESESIDMRDPLPHSRVRDKLSALDNLVVTPHIGGQTAESMWTAGTMAVGCIRQALAHQAPDNAVNTIDPAGRLVS